MSIDLTTQLKPTLGVPERTDGEVDADVWDGASQQLKKLDRHTRMFMKMVRAAVKGWKSNMPSDRDISPPLSQGRLPAVKLPFGGLEMPSVDEDWPHQGITRATALRVLRSGLFPLTDDDRPWASREEALAAMREALPVGEYLARPNHHWDEMTSDEAMSRIAFAGMGALRLLRVTEPDPDGAVWVSDLAFMASLEVRPGFERYGAVAYFDADQRPVRIHWSHATRDVRPGDDDWEHAKWVWRCTLLVGTTVADHLVGVHWLVGNYVTHASRSCFRADHPIRRMLKPHTWRTVTINYNATFSLCPERGFVHRASALQYKSMLAAMEASVGLLKYRTVPELIARKQAEGMGDDFPWATDALRLYRVIEDYVEDYISTYFAGDAVVRDPDVQAFWKKVQSASAEVGIPDLTRANLVGLLSQFIWVVTGMHESVGSVLEYVLDPTFMGTKIRPGREMSDVQATMQCLLIIGLTGLEMPGLLGDFSHVALDDKGRACFARFQANLRALSARIQKDNERRRWPCNTFDPAYLETGVSI